MNQSCLLRHQILHFLVVVVDLFTCFSLASHEPMLAFTNKMYTSSTFRSLAAAANDWQSAEWQSAQAAPTTAGTTALRDPSPWNETDFDPYAGWPSPSPFPSHSTSNNNDGQQVATIAAVAKDDSRDVTTVRFNAHSS